jgi:hypothetical protein
VAQLLDRAVNDFQIQEVEMRIMELQDSGKKFPHQSGLKVVFRTIQEGANLGHDLIVGKYRAGAILCGFHGRVHRHRYFIYDE